MSINLHCTHKSGPMDDLAAVTSMARFGNRRIQSQELANITTEQLRIHKVDPPHLDMGCSFHHTPSLYIPN